MAPRPSARSRTGRETQDPVQDHQDHRRPCASERWSSFRRHGRGDSPRAEEFALHKYLVAGSMLDHKLFALSRHDDSAGHSSRSTRKAGVPSDRRSSGAPGLTWQRLSRKLSENDGIRTEPTTFQQAHRARMSPPLTSTSTLGLHRLLPAALAIVLAWLAAGRVEAAAPASAGGHAHTCRCGTSCRGGCCCDRESVPPTKPASVTPPPPAENPDDQPACPCFESRPCHGPGLPSVPPGAAGASDVLATLAGDAHGLDGGAFAIPTSESSPARRASRLDRPPDA